MKFAGWLLLCVLVGHPALFAAGVDFFDGGRVDSSMGGTTFPLSSTLGDFDGDGILDEALSYTNASNTLGISFGTHRGIFPAPTVFYPIGTQPRFTTSGDLNGDGRRDIIVADYVGNAVNVLLNVGGGTFGPTVTFPTGVNPRCVAIADFNRDGKQDLAVANAGENTVSILLGDGAGGFSVPTAFPTSPGPNWLAAGDFNNDGFLDLAVANYEGSNGNTLLGDGNGGFGSPITFSPGARPFSVVTADFNHDGNLDLGVSNWLGSTVCLMLGTGTGHFNFSTQLTTSLQPEDIVTADFNEDGHPDLATSTIGGDKIEFFLGNGAGGLTATTVVPTLRFPRCLGVGDINNDGHVDLVALIAGNAAITTVLGTGTNVMAAPQKPATGDAPASVVSADMNDDGRPDLVTANAAGNSVSVILATASGPYAPAVHYPMGISPSSVAVADFNADGLKDVVVSINAASGMASVRLGTGAGALGAATDYIVGSMPRGVAVADVNADSFLDLVVANSGSNTVSVLLGNGSGGFGAATSFAAGTEPSGVTIANFNADGIPDIAVANDFGNGVSILIGAGGGTFSAPTFVATGNGCRAVVAGDMDADGDIDIAAANALDNTVTVLRNNGSGAFSAPTNLTTGTGPAAIIAADFDGDGTLDLATANAGGNALSVFLAQAPGVFEAKRDFSTPAQAALATGDLNLDGRLDLIAANPGANGLSLLLNVSRISVIYFPQPADHFTGDAPFGLFAIATDNEFNLKYTCLSGPATINVNQCILTGGTGFVTIRASLAGQDNFIASTPVDRTFFVGKRPQTITFGALANKVATAAPFALSATGGASGNAVTYTIVSGPASVAGSTVTLSGAVGVVTVRASQAGNAQYEPAPSVERTFNVTLQQQTITFGALANKTVFDVPFAVSATGGASGNPVTFSIVTGPATLAGSTVTPSGAAGIVIVRASQAGNATYEPAPNVDRSFAVKKLSQTLTFNSVPNQEFGSPPVNLIASGGPSGNAVTFILLSGPVSITGNAATILGAGDVTIRAFLPGNGQYEQAPIVDRFFRIFKKSQFIFFPMIPDRALADGPFTVNATGGTSGNPVTYTILSGPATVDGNLITPTGAIGDVTVRASQLGNANYSDATPVDRTFGVGKFPQTITFPPISDKTFGDPPFALIATGGGSANPVTFAVFGGPATISDTTLTITGSGFVTVRASQAADATHTAATPVDRTFFVERAPQTITFSAIPDKTFGDAPFTVQATGGASGNPVTFTVFGPADVTGNTVTILDAGFVTIRASQAGNANYADATEVDRSFTVNPAPQVITFAPLPDRLLSASPFTVSATGGVSGNPVTFSIVSGPATIDTATNTISLTGVGAVTVRASQLGSGSYLDADDVDRSFNVVLNSQTITFDAPANRTFGDAPFMLSATGGASGNPVTFAVVSGPATLMGATLTMTGAGDVAVRASQAGNSNYLAAADVERTFNVAKRPQTITFDAPGNRTFGDAPFTLSATGGASGNAVTFVVVSGNAMIAGTTLTLTGAGDVVIRASQAGGANDLAAPDVERTFNVAKRAQAISFAALGDRTFGDAPIGLSATGGVSGNAVTFAIVSGPASIAGATLTLTGAGDVVVRASQAGDGNHLDAPGVERQFHVNKAASQINWLPPVDIVSGTPLSAAQLNASASVEGTFAYTPAQGVFLPRGDGQQLRVTFAPANGADYESASAIVLINVLNATPTLMSALTIQPNPAIEGESVSFQVVASDVDADALTYAWDFGDGVSGAGATATHVFAAAGTYAVSISISDGNGGTLTAVGTVAIGKPGDRDGDGFSDELEIAAGSSPFSAGETPTGAAASDALPLGSAKLAIKLSFAKTATDKITLSGALALTPQDAPIARLLVDIGGVTRSFSLNSKGSAASGADKATIVVAKKGNKPAKLTLTLVKGSFSAVLAAHGLTNSTVKAAPVTVPVMLIVGRKAFTKVQPMVYSATRGKTASARNSP